MTRIAFCCGIDAYVSLPALSYAAADAREVFQVLTDPRFGDCSPDVSVLLTDASKAQVEREFEKCLAAATADDQLLIYFACHGQLSKDLGLYLCSEDTDSAFLASSGIALETLDNILRWSNVKHSLLMLDCCFGGAALKGTRYRGFGAPNGAFEKVSGRGRIVISASDQMQPSRESDAVGHGLFTHHLLEGIRSGSADVDSDGLVSTNDLFRYVYLRVAEDSKSQQRPVYTGVDVEGEFFVSHNPERQFRRITSPIDQRKMTLVPAGEFHAGQENSILHLQGYYIDAYPVTNADYALFVEATGHRLPKHWQGGGLPEGLEDHPVVFVDYADAAAYARWAGKRLPTSMEWEKAGRGEQGYPYPWGHAPTVAKCNVRESGLANTSPVDRYRSGGSPFGVYDLAGNVWEWCATASSAGRRVLRGASFHTPFEHARLWATNDASESMMDDDTGFRCAANLDIVATIETGTS